jgi:glycine hydroxymethyltransferase
LRNKGVNGRKAEVELDKVGITVNRNMIPGDPEKPWRTSGIRIGTPAVTTRGFRESEMVVVAELVDRALSNLENGSELAAVRRGVSELTARFPLAEGVA